MEQQRIPLQLITHSYACFVPSYTSSQQQNLLFSDKQNNLESIGENLSRIVLPKIKKKWVDWYVSWSC